METKHKKLIQRNHSELLNNCNFQRLLPKLVEKKVFTNEIAKAYEKCDLDSKRSLLIDILGQGPNAFENLVASLRDTNQNYLANKLLGLRDNGPVRNHTNPFQLPTNDWNAGNYPGNLNINSRTEPLRVLVNRSTSFKDDFKSQITPYTMRSRTRGAVLIINNKNFDNKPRNGAQVDEDNLQDLFAQMGGYNVTLHVDLDKENMMNAVQDFAKSDILRCVNVMFVIIMSHGHEKNNESVVEGLNGQVVHTTWIEQQFYGDKCPFMQNKPKIIIYQICRGAYKDHGVNPVETDGRASAPVRTHSDMLICHSTTQGYKAHRNSVWGTWYIQSVCEKFMRHACEYHIEDLLRMVDEDLRNLQAGNRGTMQTANFHNLGFRICYLNPGIYEESGQLLRFD